MFRTDTEIVSEMSFWLHFETVNSCHSVTAIKVSQQALSTTCCPRINGWGSSRSSGPAACAPVRHSISHGWQHFYTARSAGRDAGFLSFWLDQSVLDRKIVSHISQLYVKMKLSDSARSCRFPPFTLQTALEKVQFLDGSLSWCRAISTAFKAIHFTASGILLFHF